MLTSTWMSCRQLVVLAIKLIRFNIRIWMIMAISTSRMCLNSTKMSYWKSVKKKQRSFHWGWQVIWDRQTVAWMKETKMVLNSSSSSWQTNQSSKWCIITSSWVDLNLRMETIQLMLELHGLVTWARIKVIDLALYSVTIPPELSVMSTHLKRWCRNHKGRATIFIGRCLRIHNIATKARVQEKWVGAELKNSLKWTNGTQEMVSKHLLLSLRSWSIRAVPARSTGHKNHTNSSTIPKMTKVYLPQEVPSETNQVMPAPLQVWALSQMETVW